MAAVITKSIRQLDNRERTEIYLARLQSHVGGWCETCQKLSDTYSPYGDPTGFLKARYEAIQAGQCRCDTTITDDMRQLAASDDPGDIPDCPF